MDDVRKAFDAGAFLSAISMALTLPDVCGARLYSSSTSCGERYAKWFDQYVAHAYMSSSSEVEGSRKFQMDDAESASHKANYFSGADCYQLRCVYLHEGINAPHTKGRKPWYNAIQFRVFDEAPIECDCIGLTMSCEEPEGFHKVDLDLRKFLESLEEGINRFLDEHPEMNEDEGSTSFLYQPVLDFRSGVAKNL